LVRVTLLRQTTAKATLEECTRLGLDPSQSVLRLVRLRRPDDRPPTHETATLALDRLPGLDPDREPPADIRELAATLNLSLGTARERLSATRTTPEIAAHLGIAINTPVLKIDRVIETADGVPLLWQILLTPFAP
jgi:DNA-binding GntR family transcriptional regulator